MGKECEHLQVSALTEYLQIGVTIEYLDGRFVILQLILVFLSVLDLVMIAVALYDTFSSLLVTLPTMTL